MYHGYLSFGGREIINVARTVAYVENSDAPIPLEDCYDSTNLREALGDAPYRSALADDAPWYDPNRPATARFYGLYPLDISGIEDSTAFAQVAESIGSGGTVGEEREATRPVRVSGMLLAGDTAAMDAGMAWLRAALAPGACDQHSTGTCGGAQLCYFIGRPDVGRCFEEEYSAGFTQPIVNTTPASSPTVFRDSSYNGIWKADMQLGQPLGAIIEWGAVNQDDDTEVVERHGPVLLNRENYVAVPVFEGAGAGGGGYWSAAGGGALIYPTIDGVQVLERSSTTTVTTRTLAMPGSIGPVAASFELMSPDVGGIAIKARIRASSGGAILSEATFLIGDGWQRFSFSAPSGSNVYLELESNGTMRANRFQVEPGTFATPFFHGGMAWNVAAGDFIDHEQDGQQYEVKWTGTPFSSTSTSKFIGRTWVGAEASAVDFDAARAGTCDTYPWLNVLQGMVTGTLEVAFRSPIPVERQVEPYERTLHDVKRTQGPLVVGERITDQGGVIRFVDFTLVAGKPGIYSTPKDLMIDQRMSELVTVPVWDVNCADPEPVTIIDPDCPPVPAPPLPPSVPNACVTTETAWQRYWLSIPEELVSAWSKSILQVTVRSGAEEIRQVRARAYPNPFGRSPANYLGTRENRSDNAGLRLDATGWSNVGGIGTATGRVVGGTLRWGLNHYRATATGAHAADTFGVTNTGPGLNRLLEGELWRPSIDVRSSVARNLKLRYVYLNAADVVIGSAAYGPVTAASANTWTRLKLSGTAPITAPAGTVRVSVGAVGDGTAWATGQTLDAAAPNIEVSNAWGTFTIDGWWDAFRLADDGSPMDPDGFYYGWNGDVGVAPSVGMSSPIDPCSFCAEFVISYLPSQTQLTVDAILERSYASIAGAPAAAANHLLFSGDGSPIIWPELTCGMEYLVAIDVPEPLLDDVYVSVSAATKE